MAVDEAWLNRKLEEVNRMLRELPPSVAASFAPVVANLQATIIATIQATYSTTAQMNAAIANPGTINPSTVNAGNMNASGQVTSAAPVKSPGSYNYTAQNNRRTMWIDDSFQMGQTSSSVRYKKDFTEITDDDMVKVLSLQPVLGRYNWEAEDSLREWFLIAEDVAALGIFGQDVLVRDSEGRPDGINYSQLVGPLLAICRMQQRSLHSLSARVAAIDDGDVIEDVADLPSAADQPITDPVTDPNPGAVEPTA